MAKIKKRLFIDDYREVEIFRSLGEFAHLNEGQWEQAWTPEEAIETLEAWRDDPNIIIAGISFDHDLKSFEIDGYQILCMVERWVHEGQIPLPRLYIHTANYSVRGKMEMVVNKLEEHFKCVDS